MTSCASEKDLANVGVESSCPASSLTGGRRLDRLQRRQKTTGRGAKRNQETQIKGENKVRRGRGRWERSCARVVRVCDGDPS